MVHIDLEPQALPIEIPGTEKKRMLEVEVNESETHLHINASSLSILQSCPRKAYYSLHRELRSKNQSPALIFGSALHKALEVFYSAPRSERSIPSDMAKNFDLMGFGNSTDLVSDSRLAYRVAEAFITAAQPLSDLPDMDKRSIPNGLWILSQYLTHYIKELEDPYVIEVDSAGKPMTELTLAHLLHEEPGLKITVFGTVDAILRNEAQDQLLICDHKTSSQLGKDFYNRLNPNHQYACYTWLAQQCLALETDLFMVNGIEVKAKPKTARGSGPKFVRQITRRTAEDLAEFKTAMVYWGKQYLDWMKTDQWPIGTVDSCAMWGGCTYLKVCSCPLEIRSNVIGAEYEA